MKLLFLFLLFALFFSLSEEKFNITSIKIKDDPCHRRVHGGCAFPKVFACRNGKWGCYPRNFSYKKLYFDKI